MRISTILPTLAVAAKNGKNKKGGERKIDGEDRFVAAEVTDDCKTILGADFGWINVGSRGMIKILDYPDALKCKYVVQANSGCEAIKIKYRSVAIEGAWDESCEYDGFRFGWSQGTRGMHISPRRCNCFGDGCSDNSFENDFEYWTEYQQGHLGPTEFSVKSNSFTFFLESDSSISKGHVWLDWQCVPADSVASIDLVTLTTGKQETCAGYHAGYEVFRNQVIQGISDGLNNEIIEFSRNPDFVTSSARKRVGQAKRWFTNIFDVWYSDIVDASKDGYRPCLTDNFPYDSPGFLDKDSVL